MAEHLIDLSIIGRGQPAPTNVSGGMTREQLMDMLAQAGNLIAAPLGGFNKASRNVALPGRPPINIASPPEVGPSATPFGGRAMGLMNELRNIGPKAFSKVGQGLTEYNTTGHSLIDLSKPSTSTQSVLPLSLSLPKGLTEPISRRQFFKTGAGAAATGYAMVKGGQALEKAIPEAMAPASAPAAAPAITELGASPLRVYERVGNKFILTHESNLPDWHNLTHRDEAGRTVVSFKGAGNDPVLMTRPIGGIRKIDPYNLHPELEMLGEPGAIRSYDPRIEAMETELSDPYAKRLVELHKEMNSADIESAKKLHSKIYFSKPDEAETMIAAQAGKRLPSYHPPTDTIHSYIVEKPVQVRYLTRSGPYSEGHGHPEIQKLPDITGNGMRTPAETHKARIASYDQDVRLLVGSGDTYDEAIQKAESFLHDIEIDPKSLKVGAGKKIIRWTLPNGDVIEIRKVPSLDPGNLSPIPPGSSTIPEE